MPQQLSNVSASDKRDLTNTPSPKTTRIYTSPQRTQVTNIEILQSMSEERYVRHPLLAKWDRKIKITAWVGDFGYSMMENKMWKGEWNIARKQGLTQVFGGFLYYSSCHGGTWSRLKTSPSQCRLSSQFGLITPFLPSEK